MGYTVLVYDSLAHFLTTFSAQYPLAWALLVMATIAAAGLLLYGFWELTRRGLGGLLGSRRGANVGGSHSGEPRGH